ncbi:unnamed protein product [Prunus armeniaca]|uniref:DUF659 domain-containing protein n=1 Tax=Prunus armeniaca TaxID=36596 RepID=A0A6J5W143_PRUAR|nr:unnamed protein product [Prunus armeniaca]
MENIRAGLRGEVIGQAVDSDDDDDEDECNDDMGPEERHNFKQELCASKQSAWEREHLHKLPNRAQVLGTNGGAQMRRGASVRESQPTSLMAPSLYKSSKAQQKSVWSYFAGGNVNEGMGRLITKFFIYENVPAEKGSSHHFKNMVLGCQQANVGVQPPTPYEFVDTSDHIKNYKYIYKLLRDVIMEVGEHNVVQVVTDNGSAFVKARKKPGVGDDGTLIRVVHKVYSKLDPASPVVGQFGNEGNQLYQWIRPLHLDDDEGNPALRVGEEAQLLRPRPRNRGIPPSSNPTQPQDPADTNDSSSTRSGDSLTTIGGNDEGYSGAGGSGGYGNYVGPPPGFMSPFTGEANFTHATQDEDHGSRRARPRIGAIGKDYTCRERGKTILSSQ